MQELDKLMRYWRAASLAGEKCVMASIVATEGSSYRKAGARMLVRQNGQTHGAVSGGCVEKAVAHAAKPVFADGKSRIMQYDGRHRLGCNGMLYILLEPIDPTDPEAFFSAFAKTRDNRKAIEISSSFDRDMDGRPGRFGTVFRFDDLNLNASTNSFELHTIPAEFNPASTNSACEVFTKVVNPPRQLFVIGAEYDATVLASLAANQGWKAVLVTHPRNPLEELLNVEVRPVDPPELLNSIQLDDQSAVVLMTHSYARDLAYLRSLAFAKTLPYLGLLGPSNRRDQLLNELTEHTTDLPDWMLENVYGPAGIDLGGERPEEIALSIMAELIAVFSGTPSNSLRDKRGNIHEQIGEA